MRRDIDGYDRSYHRRSNHRRLARGGSRSSRTHSTCTSSEGADDPITGYGAIDSLDFPVIGGPGLQAFRSVSRSGQAGRGIDGGGEGRIGADLEVIAGSASNCSPGEGGIQTDIHSTVGREDSPAESIPGVLALLELVSLVVKPTALLHCPAIGCP